MQPDMPISEKRLAANRANAQKSTGPRGATGKTGPVPSPHSPIPAAIRPGLFVKSLLLAGESPDRFASFLRAFEHEFLPTTVNERLLVNTMAFAQWRIIRLRAGEAAAINLELNRRPPASGSLNLDARTFLALRSATDTTRQEVRLGREYRRALDSFLRLRAHSQKASPGESRTQ